MRKALLAALVAAALMFPLASTETGLAKAAPTQGTVSELLAVPHDRTAKAVGPDGKVHDFGGHNDNPFPSAEACTAGMEADTKAIFQLLQVNGIDISAWDVVVTCAPTKLPGA